MRRIALLVNPVFSAWRRRSIPHIHEIFSQAGITVDLVETGPNREASVTARRAAEEGADAVIVCGGDGTVFDVLQGLAGTGVSIGICPFGTGNILVQNLGLPRDPVAAAHALLTAKPVTVPLGKVTCGDDARSWYFAMAAGIGGHAAMMKAALHYRKHRTGRLAYFAAGFEVLALHPLQLFELEMTTVAGEQLTRRVSEMIAVRVSELNIWRPGGGLEHPFLRVATVEGASRARLARASFESLALGSGQRHRSRKPGAAALYDDVVRIVARRIAPADREHRRPLSLQVDGEILAAIRKTAPATIEMAARNAIFLSGRS